VAAFQLEEFVLLACHFSVSEPAPDEEESATAKDGDEGHDEGHTLAEEEPREESAELISEVDLPGLRLRYSATVDEDDRRFALIMEATIVDSSLPLELTVVTGSRISRPEDLDVTPEAAAGTLVFMSYPYLREVISSITGRSPISPVLLPPLTKLPHPRVTGEANEDDEGRD
jgi:hypothetical protein